MGLKIKGNDDRVRGAITAVLLIGRERLKRGASENLIKVSLEEYRADPETYKASRRTWPDAHETSSLSKTADVAYYQNLLAATERLATKLAESKIQFNSLLELDNYLIASLERVK
jgi:hypothetical protein